MWCTWRVGRAPQLTTSTAELVQFLISYRDTVEKMSVFSFLQRARRTQDTIQNREDSSATGQRSCIFVLWDKTWNYVSVNFHCRLTKKAAWCHHKEADDDQQYHLLWLMNVQSNKNYKHCYCICGWHYCFYLLLIHFNMHPFPRPS